MGQQQSKDELLYQQVSYGNAEGIKTLRRDGAGLEWLDREGKTPLILACMKSELYNVAKTLIDLGANVNAYRRGCHAGTPLHHAAKRGLENTVKLLLTGGANPLLMNDDCQTPLEVARAKGYSNVVRAIESHICLFSGWMREFFGPGFLEVFAPQLLSRRVWVVILPVGSQRPVRPFKLELALYTSLQDARPRTLVALWKASLEEPNPNQSDALVTIVDNSTIQSRRRLRRRAHASHGRCRPQIVRQARIKLAPANEGERQQLRRFCDACKGIPQPMLPVFLQNSQLASAPTTSEDLELAMAISASLESAKNNTANIDHHSINEASSSTNPIHSTHVITQAGPSTSMEPIPSAPPLIPDLTPENGPIQYPSIDSSPVFVPSPSPATSASKNGENKDGSSALCTVCLDAPSEAVCVPCGHVAGCISCLNEIKSKNWGCPVCRAKIDQVIKLYRV